MKFFWDYIVASLTLSACARVSIFLFEITTLPSHSLLSPNKAVESVW